MSYSDFTLDKVRKTFDLIISDKIDIFASIPPIECFPLLAEILQENIPLALASNTEKSRSEMIIAPILIAIRKSLNNQISLFSGIDFTVDAPQGLNGNCDFIISRSPELLILNAPIITIVEAKKENINARLGQCVAEMLAAKLFNEREGNNIKTIYGTVTTGTNWKFLKLIGQVVEIDLGEHYISDIGKILGILSSILTEEVF
ncbi:hypothetical protein VF14_07250 [Nostoc linckia z18]|uniref:Uncharacterized protein n=2 Tax=Nostoc linckia TaxID=92942 RepID=A0A9Q5ZEV4_NOSLI|nr:hypothetical protein [Nostoc linckia]PHK42775.1 hypothetical protein VF12_01610 [Nostoc linckia z15]PHK47398.1 hypothetical protein VF13_05620 [Nostoc linckia z16]PHJ62000.1 hypothetical protein VF02_18485 [Nostoc linckia z1]PHJ66353.1 hypothetical protein VF05_19320 [Nostoc linckia z3]PHJ73121.1 hypothetical protein VF03_17095 [Nostoc linckia z2]